MTRQLFKRATIPRYLHSVSQTFGHRTLFQPRVFSAMSSPNLTPRFHSFITPSPSDLTLSYTVHSRDVGTSQQLIVVSPPAWGLPPSYLSGLLPLTDSGYTLLFFHPRGSSGSSLPKDTTVQQNEDVMSPFTLATDLEHLRTHLNLDSFPTLLGHSHGGTIALCYAELFPTHVKNLILLDHRLLGFNDSSNFKHFYHSRHGDSRYEKAYDAYLSKHEPEPEPEPEPESDEEFTEWWKTILPMYFFAPEKYVQPFLGSLGDATLSTRSSRHVDLANKSPRVMSMMQERLKDATAQTLMIFGREDAQCSVQNAEETKKGVPHAEIVILEECGHFPWIEQPGKTFEAIHSFLR